MDYDFSHLGLINLPRLDVAALEVSIIDEGNDNIITLYCAPSDLPVLSWTACNSGCKLSVKWHNGDKDL